VSNTGPLISAFQSMSMALVWDLFQTIYVPDASVKELIAHGWKKMVDVHAKRLVRVHVTKDEEHRSISIAREIAQDADCNDPIADHHLGEAQAIVVSLRPAHRNCILLLDELAARTVAKRMGIRLTGFPGVLLAASNIGLITPDDLKRQLEICREQGTHYSKSLIRDVYTMAKQRRSVQ